MATPNYYPPRGHGWGFWRRWALWLRRVTYADHIKISPGTWTALGGLLVPGRGFFMAGQSRMGRLSRAVYVLALVLFLLRFGLPEAQVGFGLAVAIHAGGIIYWLRPVLADLPPWQRVGGPLILLVLVWMLLYLPLLGLLGQVLYPLQTKDEVIVCNALANPHRIQSGDWMAYRVPERRRHGFHVQEGFGLGRVYGMPGDQIAFFPDRFTVNGLAHYRHAHMPRSGQWNVPTNAWFVWSQYVVITRVNVSEVQLTEDMIELSMVPQKSFVGTPFRRWCGRRQNLSDVPPEKLNASQSRIAQ